MDRPQSMKTNNLNPEYVLAPFKDALGSVYAKVCNDIKAQLGRLDKDVVTKSSGWTVGAKHSIVSKDGHKLLLPPNAEWTYLLRFGMQFTAIREAGSTAEPQYDMAIVAEIPAICRGWIEKELSGSKVNPATVGTSK